MKTNQQGPIPSFSSWQDYAAFIRQQKKARKLHGLVESRLIQLLKQFDPDAYATAEVSAVLGGRNDLMQFSFDGRRVVFELFFSPSQVPQDLRLLEQCAADVKIAVLLDEQIDPKLAEEYFHKKPNHFPFMWLRILFLEGMELAATSRLRELIDERAPIPSLRRILVTPAGNQIAEQLSKLLERIETQLSPPPPAPKLDEMTLAQIMVLVIVARIQKLGVSPSRLQGLRVWLDNSIEWGIRLVLYGFQAFLITDLEGQHAIWTDGDFADDLIMGAEYDGNPYIVMCLNKTINDCWEATGHPRATLGWHFFHTYAEHIGKIVPKWQMDADKQG